jgi:hypothetical protein
LIEEGNWICAKTLARLGADRPLACRAAQVGAGTRSMLLRGWLANRPNSNEKSPRNKTVTACGYDAPPMKATTAQLEGIR